MEPWTQTPTNQDSTFAWHSSPFSRLRSKMEPHLAPGPGILPRRLGSRLGRKPPSTELFCSLGVSRRAAERRKKEISFLLFPFLSVLRTFMSCEFSSKKHAWPWADVSLHRTSLGKDFDYAFQRLLRVMPPLCGQGSTPQVTTLLSLRSSLSS